MLRMVPLPRFAGEDLQRRRLEILPCREAAGEGDRPKHGGGGRARTYGASRRARIHAIASSRSCNVSAFGRGRPAHHDDLDPEHARRLDLGVGRAPAAVLGHQRVDPLAFHQLELVGERERTARENQLAEGQGVDLRRPVDRPHDVPMLGHARESGELQPPLGEERRSRLGPQRLGRVLHGRDLGPPVAGLSRPGRAGEDDERRVRLPAGGDGVGRHAGRERMGGVDDGVDALAREIGGEACDAAEAADAQRDRRRRRGWPSRPRARGSPRPRGHRRSAAPARSLPTRRRE